MPFPRLLAIEARKLFDTRSAMVITAILLALAVAAIAGRAAYLGPDLQRLIWTAGISYGTLLPVLGILAVTGEWSHRTTLTTFALEPRRWRVIVAKTVPPMAATVVACLFAVLVALPATAVTGAVQGVPAEWNAELAGVAGWTLTLMIFTVSGVALGALLLNGPAAIVIHLTSTIVWNTVALLSPTGETLAAWLDLNRTTAPLASGELTAADLAPLAVSVTLWIVVPLALGILRVSRKEIK